VTNVAESKYFLLENRTQYVTKTIQRNVCHTTL